MRSYVIGFFKGVLFELAIVVLFSLIVAFLVPNAEQNIPQISQKFLLLIWLINFGVSLYLISKYKLPHVWVLVALIFGYLATIMLFCMAEVKRAEVSSKKKRK